MWRTWWRSEKLICVFSCQGPGSLSGIFFHSTGWDFMCFRHFMSHLPWEERSLWWPTFPAGCIFLHDDIRGGEVVHRMFKKRQRTERFSRRGGASLHLRHWYNRCTLYFIISCKLKVFVDHCLILTDTILRTIFSKNCIFSRWHSLI